MTHQQGLTQRRWDVFIAFGEADYKVAKQVYDKLLRHVSVFLYKESLRGGDDGHDVAFNALDNSSIVIVIVGPTFGNTHFLRSEILRSIENSRRNVADPQIVFPVLLGGSSSDLPHGLEGKYFMNLAEDTPSDVAREVLGILLDKRNRHLHNLSEPTFSNDEDKLNAELLKIATTRRDKLKTSGSASETVLLQAEKEVRKAARRMRAGGVLQPGDQLSERFLLLEQIGSGGFAHVWLAKDQETGTNVAVKILRGDLLNDSVASDRFARGAMSMKTLDHPNICRIISTEGLLDSSAPRSSRRQPISYYAMEFLSGGDLQSNILAGKLGPERILSAILQVGDGLDYAHTQGIVHRDVKPANILLTEQGDAKLTDFDLAMSRMGTIHSLSDGVGTFIYAAPEQQVASDETEGTADIYSLGMTTLFALYGETLPLEVVRSSASFIEELHTSPDVRNILRRAVAWYPNDRYSTVGDYCKELRGAWQPGTTYMQPKIVSRLLPKIDVELIFVPGGTMQMGDDSATDTQPCHEVTFQGFWIGRFPITNANYELFRAETAHEPSAFGQTSGFDDPTQPVLGVCISDAVAFCEWLAQFVAKESCPWWSADAKIRLPSEAEWEYVARGPAARKYPWGFRSPNATLANYGDAIGKPTSVGNYPEGASWISAQDMAGNVWEWCEDCWHDDYQNAPTDGSAWMTGDPSKRVVRGGSFHFAERGLASYYRYWWNAEKRQGNQGFRLVVSGIPPIPNEDLVKPNAAT